MSVLLAHVTKERESRCGGISKAEYRGGAWMESEEQIKMQREFGKGENVFEGLLGHFVPLP